MPNYDSFDNLDLAFSDFNSRFKSVVNAIAPIKTVRIKNNTRKWFDGQNAEKIQKQEKLYKNFKLTELHVEEDTYREALQKFSSKKEKGIF